MRAPYSTTSEAVATAALSSSRSWRAQEERQGQIIRSNNEVVREVRGGWNSRGLWRGGGRRGYQELGRGGRQCRNNDEYRRWCYSTEKVPDSAERFTILSYNILSANNAQEHWRELYYHIPLRFLRWDWRKSRLLQELEFWSADILCFQEVDRFSELKEKLEPRGYNAAYKARTGAATDGCAIFWRQNRFRLVQEENIEFREFGLRDNVAQLCLFESMAGDSTTSSEAEPTRAAETIQTKDRRLVVANTHVLFNPRRGEIKLGQVRTLLNRAHALSLSCGGAPVVVAGDFNSTPMSPLYRFLVTSELDVSALDRWRISGQEGEIDLRTRRRFVQRSWSAPGHVLQTFEKLENVCPTDKDQPQSISNPLSVIEQQCVTTVEEKSAKSDGITQSLTVSRETVTFCVPALTNSETEPTRGPWQSTLEVCESEEHNMEIGRLDGKTYRWTPEELLAATGSTDSTVALHKLKLSSAYPEVKDQSDSRDSVGEPSVTTYHCKFMGTVDYLLHTEGLRPVKVLDTLPVEVLKRTGGLPSHKWGSDHLALACELAFVPDKKKRRRRKMLVKQSSLLSLEKRRGRKMFVKQSSRKSPRVGKQQDEET